MSKYTIDDLATKSTLLYALSGILKVLSPFMPYITDEIYGMLPVKENNNIMLTEYPKYSKKYVFLSEEKNVDDEVTFIKTFRNVKKENNITKDMKVMFEGDFDNYLIKRCNC